MAGSIFNDEQCESCIQTVNQSTKSIHESVENLDNDKYIHKPYRFAVRMKHNPIMMPV